jgi:hypothetical protein
MTLKATFRVVLFLLCAGLAPSLARAQVRTDRPPSPAEQAIKTKLNAWTVGLAGGLLEGAPIRFATEIARPSTRERISTSCRS